MNSGEFDGMDDEDEDALVYLSRVTFWVCSNRTFGVNGPVFGVR